MQRYRYITQLPDGQLQRGSLEAKNEEDAKKRLAESRIVATHLELVPDVTKKKKKGLAIFNRVPLGERVIFTQNLAILIKSGLPIAQGLSTLAQQTKNKHFAEVLLDIKSSLERGDGFAQSLQRHVDIFSEVFIAMISAGEASGKLELILNQLALQMKKERVLIGKIRSALTYPVIVVIAMIGLGIGMMVFVIPKITSIYDELGGDLPAATKFLIGMSDFVVNNAILVTVLAVGLIIGFRFIVRTHGGKKAFHGLLLRAPIAAVIIKKIQIARFTRTLESLLTTEIPIVQSLAIIEHTLSNVHYQIAMQQSREALKRGNTITDALKQFPKLFPPLVLQMISVGETSGRLDELAGHIATFYEEDVDETMASFSSIIEPVLMLALGVGVAAMAIAILLPMYTLTDTI